MLRRTLTTGVSLFVLPLGALAACGSGDSGNPGADALCSSFDWNAKQGLGANEKRMQAIVAKASSSTSLGSAVNQASKDCPDVVSDYLDAVQSADADTGTDTSAEKASDVENPQLTEQLDARGVDIGAVIRLGGAMDLLGIGSSTKDPMSVGAAQRLALTTLDTCDAVSSGQTTWDAYAQSQQDAGLSAKQANTLAAYLRLHFCTNVK